MTGDKLKRLIGEHATAPHDLFVDFKHKRTLKVATNVRLTDDQRRRLAGLGRQIDRRTVCP